MRLKVDRFLDSLEDDFQIGAELASRGRDPQAPRLETAELSNEEMGRLFEAVVEATEEAIYNSIFMATTVESRSARVEAIPLDAARRLLERYRGAAR